MESMIRVDEIYIDLSQYNAKTNPSKRDSQDFTIRGFTSQMREKDPKICMPFPIDIYKEQTSVQPSEGNNIVVNSENQQNSIANNSSVRRQIDFHQLIELRNDNDDMEISHDEDKENHGMEIVTRITEAACPTNEVVVPRCATSKKKKKDLRGRKRKRRVEEVQDIQEDDVAKTNIREGNNDPPKNVEENNVSKNNDIEKKHVDDEPPNVDNATMEEVEIADILANSLNEISILKFS
uniref:Uncharacterized protein LOC113786622 n=1 Tax=Cicer arietinum TaxID=3827 RepID=A0A3Q7XRS3_CICAR|nr:uncharacterized protein LOC113786622 [Cicer arietinum]